MTITANQLKQLLIAYQNTHTPTKTFGSTDPDDAVLLQLGLLAPKDPGSVGWRTTERGDQVVDAALNGATTDAEAARAKLVAIHDALDAAHWLGGTAEQRIAALIAERDAALAGTHPVQLARSRDAGGHLPHET